MASFDALKVRGLVASSQESYPIPFMVLPMFKGRGRFTRACRLKVVNVIKVS